MSVVEGDDHDGVARMLFLIFCKVGLHLLCFAIVEERHIFCCLYALVFFPHESVLCVVCHMGKFIVVKGLGYHFADGLCHSVLCGESVYLMTISDHAFKEGDRFEVFDLCEGWQLFVVTYKNVLLSSSKEKKHAFLFYCTCFVYDDVFDCTCSPRGGNGGEVDFGGVHDVVIEVFGVLADGSLEKCLELLAFFLSKEFDDKFCKS